ncbi:MAG: YfhO family protein, partial [Lachnospiraceae bacterium]|nr:YfhO family protein [Lachnospiraceae bacterium]
MEGKGREGQIAQGTLGKKGAALSFISAFFLALFVFTIAGIMPGGKAVSWNTDTMDQMAAFYAMLARHLKSGGSLFYSWNTSIGQNTALLYALCSYSPVLLLYMLIPDIYAATMISMIVKIALSSMFFYIFLEYGLCWKGKWNVFFSLCYAFCGFMLEYLMAFNLSDALYFLPLIMYAIMRSIRTERFLFLSLVYALSFINELYMAFLTGLFSAAALLVILYLKDGKEFIKKNLKYLIKYFFCVLAAVLMSMCLLFPAIMCYFSYNGFNSLMNVEHIGITDLLYSFFFGRPTSLRTNIPFLYCGSPVILLLPFYFIDSSISKRERIVSIASVLLMAVSLYLDPLYLFLHVFNRPDGFTVRYAFVFVFVMVILAAREVYKGNESVKKMGKARVAVYFLIMLSVALSLILLHDNIGEEADGKGVFFALIGNLVLLPLWGGVAFAALYGRNKKISVTLAYTLLLAELGVQFYFNACEYGLLPASQINEKKAQMDSFAAGLNDAGDPGEQVYRAYAAAYPG